MNKFIKNSFSEIDYEYDPMYEYDQEGPGNNTNTKYYPDQFACSSGDQFVYELCQGVPMCDDMSDLTWCYENDCSFYFACTSGDQCVLKEHICQKFSHCEDKSDLVWFKENCCHPYHKFACSSGDQCVKKNEDICKGFAMCEDKSDLAWCKAEERRYEGPNTGYTRCNTTFDYPGQQIYIIY